jgi:hypothetical protein
MNNTDTILSFKWGAELRRLKQMETKALARYLRQYLHDLRRARRKPELRLLRTVVAELAARPKRSLTEELVLGDAREWLEWDAPRYESSARKQEVER